MHAIFAPFAIACLCVGAAQATMLPQALHPPAPFPVILGDAATSEFIAPGVTFGDYELMTAEGPLSIHVIAADPSEPTVRIDSVLAGDSVISNGERLSRMAARTGAVGGINADYFDIGNTNQPLGLVIRSGQLIKTPNAQPALVITKDRHASIESVRFSANVQGGNLDASTPPIALTAVNGWPPEGGASLMTPAFGPLPPASGVIVAELTPLDDRPRTFGRYRVARVVGAEETQQPGYALALGPAVLATAHPPEVGDVLTVSENSTLDRLWAAVAGGPLLVHDGRRFAAANAPAASETNVRFPISGAVVRPNGTLVLVEVDGRTLHSIGLTRPEFASLMLALGAAEGLAFDSGGSSTLVVRRLGDRWTSAQGVPSDGSERPIADGLFIYSDAPQGPPARLVVRPAAVRAMTGATVPLEFAVTDFAGHVVAPPLAPVRAGLVPARLGIVQGGSTFIAGTHAGDGTLHVRRGSLRTDVAVHLADRAARFVITPLGSHLSAGQSAQFSLRAYDGSGFPLAPAPVRWSASSGRVDASGTFTAGARDATLNAAVGGQNVQTLVRVGEHEIGWPFGAGWRFVPTPAGNPGAIAYGVPCANCVSLQYDFTGQERAASMVVDRPLPEFPIGLRLDINGDGHGEVLRIALANSLGEISLLTFARIDWRGWQTREVRFPPTLLPPLRLHALYVLNALRSQPVRATGQITFRNLKVIAAGT